MCGRPVFEPAIAEAEAVPRAALPPTAFAQAGAASASRGGLAQLPVGFRNPIALRVAFLMSLGVMLMTIIQIALSPIWWLVAGLCAVQLYRRLTGLPLSVGSGARLGLITGVLAFPSLVIVIGVMMALKINDIVSEIKQNPNASQALNDPPAMVLGSLFVLVILFAVVVGVCAAGGALGARFAGRNAKV